MRVYLDLCAIQRPFDDAGQQRVREERDALFHIVMLIENGMIGLVGSFALEFENDANQDAERREHTERVLSLAATRIPPTRLVEARTETYKAAGIGAWDAAHLASAVEAGADFFCTCDDRLLRRARSVDTGLTRAVSLLELMVEVNR
jgi:predicted nucleic acid-binding protein